jgi:hypothetical protein
MGKAKRHIPPEEWRRALVFLAYAVTRNPKLAPSMQYAQRKYEEALKSDPVAEANKILDAYTRDGGTNAIRLSSPCFLAKELPEP